jgi:phosphoglycolate phosphatase
MEKIVIFDYDGVIVDSLDVYEKAVISVFNKNGFNQINSRKSFLDLFDGNFFESAVKIGIPPEKMPEIIKELEPNLLALQKDLKLFDGIREILAELAKKYKIYIATSNLTNVVKTYLESQNIMGFEEIIGADKETSKVKKIESIKAKYPDSEIFYVGDTKGDMIEGKLAGVKTIAVAWGWHDVDKLKEGESDYMVKKPSELLSVLEKSIRNIAVILLYDEDKKILLQHRSKDAERLPNYWGFFGGGINDNETPEEAVKREAVEELNYQLENPRLIMTQEFKGKHHDGTKYVFTEEFNHKRRK